MQKIETEKKYIIAKPDIAILKKQRGFSSSEITQIYVTDLEKTHRIRKRVYPVGRTEYTENTKKRISNMSSVEYEREISEDEFNSLALNIEDGARPLFKTRVTFEYFDKILEIDIYPEWKETAVLEVELDSENEQIEFPDFIKILCDVTGKREYSNHRMAHSFPKELI